MRSLFIAIKAGILQFFKGAKLGLIGIQAYYHYPRLVVFPFIYGLFATTLCLAIVSMVLISYGLISHVSYFTAYSETTLKTLTALGFVIGIYIACLAYVIVQVGICSATAASCENSRLGFASALRMSLRKWKTILPWSALIILVTLFLRKKGKGRFTTRASLWHLVTNTTWDLVTFSVYPTIAFENASLLQTLNKSIAITRENFGTMSGIRLSLSALNSFGITIAIGLAFGGLSLIRLLAESYIPAADRFLMLSSITIAGAYFLFIIFEAVAFINMAETIISTIIYRHIHHQKTGVFAHEQLATIIQSTALVPPAEGS